MDELEALGGQVERPLQKILQSILVGDDHLAVDTESRGHAADQVKIGGVEFTGGSEEAVEESPVVLLQRDQP